MIKVKLQSGVGGCSILNVQYAFFTADCLHSQYQSKGSDSFSLWQHTKAMGDKPSKCAEAPLLDEPWRQINWGKDKQRDLHYMKNFKHRTEGQQLRILLHGPPGAGKSSFINSVQSVLLGRMYTLALAANIAHECFTKQYSTYEIQKENPETFYPFVFNDTRGLSQHRGVLADDVKLALRGHVKDGYMFNPESKLSEGNEFYNKSPTVNDKVHVLVCIVPADTLSSMSDKTVQKLRDIRLEASRLGIPQVTVLTKVEEACPEIKRDLKNVYRSINLKEKMQKFSADVGIPMNCIFPVRNYYEEIDLYDDTDTLILSAMRRIIDHGEDFINRKTV
ncbi:interferon-induced protein 44 [Lates calcarifer]|uniref:Interferon-induced protein 44 n=1 Tax=Lates calcarifer TaxID=8187 RepID=A0AAJ7V818_LATCA|nr:interferon-induced protein 44 [Lates calcarifer]